MKNPFETTPQPEEEFPQQPQENDEQETGTESTALETGLRVPEKEQIVVTSGKEAEEFIAQNPGYEYHIIPLNKEGEEQEAFAIRSAEELPSSFFAEGEEVLVRINTNMRV